MELGWSCLGYLRSEHCFPWAYFVNNSYLVFSYFGSYGVCSRRKFDKNFYEKYHLMCDSGCTSCILMVGLIIGTFNEQHESEIRISFISYMDTFRYKEEMLVWVGAETPVYGFRLLGPGSRRFRSASSCWCTFFKWLPWNVRRKYRRELQCLPALQGEHVLREAHPGPTDRRRVPPKSGFLPPLTLHSVCCGWSLCWCGRGSHAKRPLPSGKCTYDWPQSPKEIPHPSFRVLPPEPSFARVLGQCEWFRTDLCRQMPMSDEELKNVLNFFIFSILFL